MVPSELQQHINEFVNKLAASTALSNLESEENGTLNSSLSVALATVAILKRIVSQAKWTSASDVMKIIRSEGRIMAARAGINEMIVGNIVRRILKIIREDYHSASNRPLSADTTDSISRDSELLHHATSKEDDCMSGQTSTKDGDPPDSLHGYMAGPGLRETEEYNKHIPDLLDSISQSIDELSGELETGAFEIREQALDHIHASEIILTVGRSKTVEMFLKGAAEKGRKFQVIVAEAAPNYQGQRLAASLAKSKIETTLITDSAIFAMMSRVNKVIVGTHSILANGGLKGPSGLHTVALAAKHYSVPVMVTASMHKLTPYHFTECDQEAIATFASPQDILRGGSGGGMHGIANGKITSKIHAINPLFEYIPPELVTLFITNMSSYSPSFAPSYVYRVLSELYHPDDYEI